MRNKPGEGRDMGDFLPLRLIFITNNLRLHSCEVHPLSITDSQYSKSLWWKYHAENCICHL